jgi:hypothetical protein
MGTMKSGPRPRPLLDRVLEKVAIGDRVDDCWEWTGRTSASGYGVVAIGHTEKRRAHRVMYELVVGPIPEGLQIDHLCRVRNCVNPDHLEPVTHAENLLRGMSPAMVAHRTGICQRGHSLEDAITKPNGWRNCRTCDNERRRRKRAEQEDAHE